MFLGKKRDFGARNELYPPGTACEHFGWKCMELWRWVWRVSGRSNPGKEVEILQHWKIANAEE